MASSHLKTLTRLSPVGRVAGSIVAVVILAALAFRLLMPPTTNAGQVPLDHAAGTGVPSVSLLISRTHARVAQYALSETIADQKAAEDSLAELNERIATNPAIGRIEGGLAALMNRYRASAESTFGAVTQRRDSIDRMLTAGTQIRTITSSIALALEDSTDSEMIRAGMALAQSFEESDAAAARFLASRAPADSNIATRTLATVPTQVEAFARLAGENRRMHRFVAALQQPLAVYAEALQGVVGANERLRVEAGKRDAASEAVLAAAATEHDRLARSDRVVVACDTILIVLCLFLLLPLLVTQFRRLKRAKAALRNKSAMLETTLSNMDQGLIMVTAERKVGVFNDRALKLLELPAGSMREGVPFDEVLRHKQQDGTLADRADDQRMPLQQGDVSGEVHAYQRQRPDGTVLEIRSAPLPGGGMVRTYTDVTQLRLAEKRVFHAARHDVLTNLPNRATFTERLGKAVADADRDGAGLAVLFIDLDRFKLVNDTLGHAAGDELLRQVAGRMLSEVRETDTLARLGGDEFAMVMPGVRDPEFAMATAERLRCSVSEPYALSQGTARVGLSIGIACHPIHAGSADELLNRADLALYRAKSSKRNMCCVFDAALDSRRQDELALEGALRLALREEQFELAYQPISDIRARRIVGAEALLRWQHPTKGFFAPLNFIPLAERTGLIVELGSWVLETACREALSWAIPISVSVNVAPTQLRRHEIVGEVRELLTSTGLPPSRLKLEITEGQLMDQTSEMFATMTALRDLGVRLVLDDFGTGYSSLGTLRSFPFSDVKIDRSFVQGIVQNRRARGLIEAILQICHVLDLNCVAEGVETEEQFALLSSLGCTHAQGYLIGHPEPPEKIRRTLWRAAAEERHGLPKPVSDTAFGIAGVPARN